MCGLAGAWHFEENIGPLLQIGQDMATQLRHRGPDASGIWCDDTAHLVLAHQRLSIVDLSAAGNQPMHSPSKRFVLICNGEIYNADELRRELIQYNISFNSRSDTEVVSAACEHWGVEQAVHRFIGMFAFVLWDSKTYRLYLVRDRLGIKPLYWGFHRGVLFFSSELKSFFAHPRWRSEIDENALTSYFRYGYIPAPQSIYKGIQKLSPGCILSVNKKGAIKEHFYWKLSDCISVSRTRFQNFHFNQKEGVDQCHQLLQEAVHYRTVADLPVGAFLSGGIDSSLVVALMQAQSHRPIKTFTIGFSEIEYNEAQHARKIAKHFGTEHHEWILSSTDALNIIPRLGTCYDEPFADSSQIATYAVSQLAREAVAVVLSGDGGDEIFAGYTRYHIARRLQLFLKLFPFFIRRFLSQRLDRWSPEQWNKFMRHFPNRLQVSHFGEKINKLSKLFHGNSQDLYLSMMSVWNDPRMLMHRGQETYQWPRASGLSRIRQMQYIDSLTYLPDDILTKVDRASMFCSLEVRVPLLDHRLIAQAWAMPVSMQYRGHSGKWILRQILSKYLPVSLMDRPKMGFGVPIDSWLRGPLREWAESLLTVERFRDHGLLRRQPILECWQAHIQGKQQNHYLLWPILMFQTWYQRWMKGSVFHD